MKKTININLIIVFFFFGKCLPYILYGSNNNWPEVMYFNKTIHFIDHKVNGVKLEIKGKNGKPLYLLECYLNAIDREDNDFNYTGDFECRLTSLFDDYYAYRNLLTDQNPQVRDWHSRGVFHIEELKPMIVEGVQIEYLSYGRIRNFRLRGMNIFLKVKNFILYKSIGKKARIKNLDFEVTILPDSTAKSAIAEPFKHSGSLYRTIKWPKIKTLREIIHFSGHQLEKINIVGQSGKPLYLLECLLNPNDNDSNEDFDYSGNFECRLTSCYDYRHSNLLTENPYPTRDWDSRGRFLVEEITGDCANYPDYGRVRNFRLRGMHLTLAIKNIELSTTTQKDGEKIRSIKSLELEITALSDSTAITEIAEPTKYMEPLFRNPNNPNELIRNCDSMRIKE